MNLKTTHTIVGYRQKTFMLGAAVALLLVAVGLIVTMHKPAKTDLATKKGIVTAQAKKAAQTASRAAPTATPATTTSTQSTPPSTVSTAPAVKKPASSSPNTPAATPTPAPTTPWVNTVNCIPQQEPQYAYYKSMTNSQYLQTNNYVNTNKLYAAFQFAGMINEINTKQYVVFAMDDSIWDNLTASQVAWMNASPANMRSVLGWQVATYCITYDGVNPIKGRSAPLAFNTLNGTVTYTAGGVGQLDGTPVYIWDWFTSNGAVTITDFIHPPVGH